MDAMLDTLAASRKLEETGMPEPQAGAVVEVVNDAMKNLVTKEYLKAELARSFDKFERRFERKIDRKLDERFGKVDETFGVFNERFAQINERFVQINERFGQVDKKFEQVDKRFEQVDKRFEQIDEKLEKMDTNFNELKLSIAELGKSQAWGVVYMCGFTIAVGALLFTALQFFGTGAAAAPARFPESGAFGNEAPILLEIPPGNDAPPPEITPPPDPATGL